MSHFRIGLSGLLLSMMAVVLSWSASPASGEHTTYGMFGERTLGGSFVPRRNTRFERGIQRGPSGNFLGLSANARFPGYAGPRSQGFRSPQSFESRTRGSVAVPQPARTVAPRRTTRPVPPRTQPAPPRGIPADIWFRGRSTRRP